MKSLSKGYASQLPIQIRARTAEALLTAVMEEIKKGNDLFTQPFVASTGEICQYMVPSLCICEYLLIDAFDLDDLDARIRDLAARGYDFMFSTVLWNGNYLQWMQRLNHTGESVKDLLEEHLLEEAVRNYE